MGLNIRAIVKTLSLMLILIGFSMMPSLLISVFYGEYKTAEAFAKIIFPVLATGALISSQIKIIPHQLKMREGFIIVALSWFFASLIGSLPYLVTETVDGFVNAFFESVSGFTTTGATIISNVEILPKGILFWRSFCQWLGGMGILIFAISILPALGISGQRIARAETPGPTLNKLRPRMSDSAKMLYYIYAVFTISAISLLILGGMDPFDASIAAFGSVASGGLSNYNSGIQHFNSAYIEFIASFFTVIACINFTLYYSIVRGRWRDFFKNSEVRIFLLILCLATAIITADLWLTGSYNTIWESLRFGFFQSSAFITTTGHYSTNFNIWTSFSKMVLFILMLIGGCSSSTGGGIKVIRVIILFKLIKRSFHVKLHPKAVIPIKVDGKIIPPDTMAGVMSFFYLYVFVFIASTFILSLENLDLLTTFTTTAAALNNVGTGLELIGPTGSFALFSDFSKVYLSFLMLMGRLELFTIILLFTPSFWNPDR